MIQKEHVFYVCTVFLLTPFVINLHSLNYHMCIY